MLAGAQCLDSRARRDWRGLGLSGAFDDRRDTAARFRFSLGRFFLLFAQAASPLPCSLAKDRYAFRALLST
jgi:hypothetical protein